MRVQTYAYRRMRTHAYTCTHKLLRTYEMDVITSRGCSAAPSTLVIIVVVIIVLIILFLLWHRCPVSRNSRLTNNPASITNEQENHLLLLRQELYMYSSLLREYAIALSARRTGTPLCSGQVNDRLDAISARLGNIIAYFTVPEASAEVAATWGHWNKSMQTATIAAMNASGTGDVNNGRDVANVITKYAPNVDRAALEKALADYAQSSIAQINEIASGNCNSSLVLYEAKVFPQVNNLVKLVANGLMKQ